MVPERPFANELHNGLFLCRWEVRRQNSQNGYPKGHPLRYVNIRYPHFIWERWRPVEAEWPVLAAEHQLGWTSKLSHSPQLPIALTGWRLAFNLLLKSVNSQFLEWGTGQKHLVLRTDIFDYRLHFNCRVKPSSGSQTVGELETFQ